MSVNNGDSPLIEALEKGQKLKQFVRGLLSIYQPLVYALPAILMCIKAILVLSTLLTSKSKGKPPESVEPRKATPVSLSAQAD